MKANGSPNKYPHRRLIMNSGDIALPKNGKLRPQKQTSNLIVQADKFTAFK